MGVRGDLGGGRTTGWVPRLVGCGKHTRYAVRRSRDLGPFGPGRGWRRSNRWAASLGFKETWGHVVALA
eukprot:7518001-Pyramimonas_sp.AAC.1